MILNASSKIAVKCSECGKYNITDLNFFKLNSPTSIKCSCGQRVLDACINKKCLELKVACIACEKDHTYRLSLRKVLEKPINIISCTNTGIEIAFLGKDDYIDNIVNRYIYDVFELFKYLDVIEKEKAGNQK